VQLNTQVGQSGSGPRLCPPFGEKPWVHVNPSDFYIPTGIQILHPIPCRQWSAWLMNFPGGPKCSCFPAIRGIPCDMTWSKAQDLVQRLHRPCGRRDGCHHANFEPLWCQLSPCSCLAGKVSGFQEWVEPRHGSLWSMEPPMLASRLHVEKTRFLGHLTPPKTYLKRQTHRTSFPDFFGQAWAWVELQKALDEFEVAAIRFPDCRDPQPSSPWPGFNSTGQPAFPIKTLTKCGHLRTINLLNQGLLVW
jgi:hypothetical protein